MNILNYLLIAVGLRTKYTTRVKLGIKRLDETFPDWREGVVTPLKAETMHNVSQCVLGQVAIYIGMDADKVRSLLGYPDEWQDSAVAGFAAYASYDGLHGGDWIKEYDGLAKEWNKQLGLK